MKKMNKVGQIIYGTIVGLLLYCFTYMVSKSLATLILNRMKAKVACSDWEDDHPTMDEESEVE